MPLSSWLHQRLTGRPQTRHTPQHKPIVRFRPQLETLEGRDVPSTLTVTNNLDSGAGSLRADIAAANPGDTINFAPSLDGQTIKLASGQLVVNKSLTIQGPGAGQLAISGGGPLRGFNANASRMFEVDGANANVTLSGLTITQGNGQGGPLYNYGGGILNINGSTLTISGCTLSGNRAGSGGAIANYGSTLTMSSCTLSNNLADSSFGGGIYNYAGTLQILNSTLSGNEALDSNGGGEGGAVYSVGFTHTVSVTGCTFSNNSSTGRGGAVFTVSTFMTISGCSFSGNVANYGSFPHIGNDIYNAASASMADG